MSTERGTVARTCAIIASVIRGHVHDRHTIARDFGITVAAGDRYIREMVGMPGFLVSKRGRRLIVSFTFSTALREGRGL